jgi:hypothetical protein
MEKESFSELTSGLAKHHYVSDKGIGNRARQLSTPEAH